MDSKGPRPSLPFRVVRRGPVLESGGARLSCVGPARPGWAAGRVSNQLFQLIRGKRADMHDFNARSDAHDAQSAFAARNLVRVARIGTHFYPLICPLGALIVPKMGISWSKWFQTHPYGPGGQHRAGPVQPCDSARPGMGSRLRGNDGYVYTLWLPRPARLGGGAGSDPH